MTFLSVTLPFIKIATFTCSRRESSLSGKIRKMWEVVALRLRFKRAKAINSGKIVCLHLSVQATGLSILLMDLESRSDKDLTKYKYGCPMPPVKKTNSNWLRPISRKIFNSPKTGSSAFTPSPQESDLVLFYRSVFLNLSLNKNFRFYSLFWLILCHSLIKN
jgi:hypothetical protein